MKTINLNVPLGFKVIEKTENMTIWQAEKHLLTKHYWRYTKAVRQNDEAYLYARYLVCPHCGKEFVFNSNSDVLLEADEKHGESKACISKTMISAWATMQMSLFEEDENNELHISSPIAPPAKFSCPNCEHTSRASSLERQVELRLVRKKVIVKCEIAEISELMSLKWISTTDLRASFPIYEVLTFNLGKGRVSVKVVDAYGAVLCQRDITSAPELLYGGSVYKVLCCNKLAMRNVKRMFTEVWKGELPYVGRQMNLLALFKMTMFVGYPASFYVCIPFAKNTYAIEESFQRQAQRLHLAKNINLVYQQCLLPQTKSVRKIMFENPGLFFYANEVQIIWSVIKDPNLVCRLLSGTSVYEILSAIHQRPGMLAYITDYCSVKGAKALVAGFEKNWHYMREQAIDYGCMSESMRMQAQKNWKDRCEKTNSIDRMPNYSLPMHCPDASVKDCTINGYHFFWLRTSNEYARAAKRLKNCLGEWQSYYSPVVCVRKKDKLVASIELYRKKVVQARGFNNQPIEDDVSLYKAVQVWMEMYNLVWINDADDFNDGDMPF